MFLVLYKALQGEEEEENVRALAAEEFKRDAMGKPVLDKALFRQAWFQLADTWTEEISEVAYTAFLTFVIQTISTAGHFRRTDQVRTINRRMSAMFLQDFKA